MKTRIMFSAMAAAGIAAAGAAAEPRHDLFLCLNQAARAQVIGSRAKLVNGLYRSADRQQFAHVGFHHMRFDAFAVDGGDPRRWYLAAGNGVLRTPDAGRTWRIVTDWTMTEAKDIAADPGAPGHVYVGLPDGIGVSRDHGQTWTRMDAGIVRKYTQTLVVDRTRAGRVLAGTEQGVFLTEDGARTWRLVHGTDATVDDLRQSPHDPRVFFGVTQSNGAIWSEDAGVTWRRFDPVPNPGTLHNCDFDATDARRLLIGGWKAGVLVSEDGGRTWTDRTAGLPRREIWRVAFDPDFPGRIYANPYQEPLFVSDDLGRTWRALGFEAATVYDMVFVPRR
jgi:photosystem II stability/assembly factor-like uncharacterized protein